MSENKQENTVSIERAIQSLYSNGILARDAEEQQLLMLWRKIPEGCKNYGIGVLAGLSYQNTVVQGGKAS